MSSLENNKIFAAVLCAGITVMLTGFVANKVMKPKELKQDAVQIEGAPVVASNAPAKPQLPDPILAMLATADLEKGAKLSKACAACHSFDKGGPIKQGPNLWNIVDAKKGHQADFKYSDGLLATGGEWTYESLNFFLWKPKKYAPGTKMNFAGLKKPEDRAAMVAWLRTLSDSPAALANVTRIAAEEAPFAEPEELAEDTEAIPSSEVENPAH